MAAELSELEDHIKQFVHDQDKLLESRLKIWIMTAVIMQVVPLVAIAFFLGGIWQNLNANILVIQSQQTQLEAQTKWNDHVERWQHDVGMWASTVNPPLKIDKSDGN